MPSRWQRKGVWYKDKTLIAILFLGLIESSFLFIQFHETVSTQNAEGVSLASFVIYLLANIGWTLWGYINGDLPLFITSIVNIIGSAMVLGAIYAYSGDEFVETSDLRAQRVSEERLDDIQRIKDAV